MYVVFVIIFVPTLLLILFPVQILTKLIRPISESFMLAVAALLVISVIELSLGIINYKGTNEILQGFLIQLIQRDTSTISFLITVGIPTLYIISKLTVTVYDMIQTAFHDVQLETKKYYRIMYLVLLTNTSSLFFSYTSVFYRLTEYFSYSIPRSMFILVCIFLLMYLLMAQRLDNADKKLKHTLVHRLFDFYQIPMKYTYLVLLSIIAIYCAARIKLSVWESLAYSYSIFLIVDIVYQDFFKRYHS